MSIVGSHFKPVGLTSFSLQLGHSQQGLRLDLSNVKVVDDPGKTFVLGVDLMYGNPAKTMLPWKVELSGRVIIPLRQEDFPWQLTIPLIVPPEARY